MLMIAKLSFVLPRDAFLKFGPMLLLLKRQRTCHRHLQGGLKSHGMSGNGFKVFLCGVDPNSVPAVNTVIASR